MSRILLVLVALVMAAVLGGCGAIQKTFTITEKEYVVVKPHASMYAPCYRGKSVNPPLDVTAFIELDHKGQLGALWHQNSLSLEALQICDLQFEELSKWYTSQEKLYPEKKK